MLFQYCYTFFAWKPFFLWNFEGVAVTTKTLSIMFQDLERIVSEGSIVDLLEGVAKYVDEQYNPLSREVGKLIGYYIWYWNYWTYFIRITIARLENAKRKCPRGLYPTHKLMKVKRCKDKPRSNVLQLVHWKKCYLITCQVAKRKISKLFGLISSHVWPNIRNTCQRPFYYSYAR